MGFNDPDTLDFLITREDWEAGQPRNCRYCPAAIALNRQYPALAPWFVGATLVWHGSDPDDTTEAGMGADWKTSDRLAKLLLQIDTLEPAPDDLPRRFRLSKVSR